MTSNWPAAPDYIPSPGQAAYFLDFDGTLVDIAPTPDQVRVEPGLADTLLRLRDFCGDALAIVTGRPIDQVDAFLPGVAYAIAGEHGTALRLAPGAPIITQPIPPLPHAWLTSAAALAQAHPGALLETKRHGFALHYRAVPEAGPILEAALRRMIAEAPGRTELMAAKMAWEIRPAGFDKGSAVRTLMQHAPFAGRVPVFIGDDVTDEDGMQAARALGGIGLRVPDVFGKPAGVRRWLAALVTTEGTGS